MSETVYNTAKSLLTEGDAELLDLRLLLLGGTVSPSSAGADDPDLDFVADVLALTDVVELVATNYARATITGLTRSAPDDTNDRVIFTIDDVLFADLGAVDGSEGPVRAALVYEHDAGGDASRRLVAFYDSGFPKTINGADFELSAPNGLLRLVEP